MVNHSLCINNTIAEALPPPINLMATTMTTSQITLTWDQQRGADAVDSYEINAEYSINHCGRGTNQILAISVSKSYTITSVEEDSSYSISVVAMNSVARSVPAEISAIITPPAGIIIL